MSAPAEPAPPPPLEAAAARVEANGRVLAEALTLRLRGRRVALVGDASAVLGPLLRRASVSRGIFRVFNEDVARSGAPLAPLALVPRDPPLPPDLTPRAFVAWGARVGLGVPRKQAADQAAEACERVGLGPGATLPLGRSSPLARRLTLLAHATALGPRLFVVEDPLEGLSPDDAGALLRAIDRAVGAAHAFVSTPRADAASPGQALARGADEVVLLEGGRVLGQGRPDEVFIAFASARPALSPTPPPATATATPSPRLVLTPPPAPAAAAPEPAPAATPAPAPPTTASPGAALHRAPPPSQRMTRLAPDAAAALSSPETAAALPSPEAVAASERPRPLASPEAVPPSQRTTRLPDVAESFGVRVPRAEPADVRVDEAPPEPAALTARTPGVQPPPSRPQRSRVALPASSPPDVGAEPPSIVAAAPPSAPAAPVAPPAAPMVPAAGVTPSTSERFTEPAPLSLRDVLTESDLHDVIVAPPTPPAGLGQTAPSSAPGPAKPPLPPGVPRPEAEPAPLPAEPRLRLSEPAPLPAEADAFPTGAAPPRFAAGEPAAVPSEPPLPIGGRADEPAFGRGRSDAEVSASAPSEAPAAPGRDVTGGGPENRDP